MSSGLLAERTSPGLTGVGPTCVGVLGFPDDNSAKRQTHLRLSGDGASWSGRRRWKRPQRQTGSSVSPAKEGPSRHGGNRARSPCLRRQNQEWCSSSSDRQGRRQQPDLTGSFLGPKTLGAWSFLNLNGPSNRLGHGRLDCSSPETPLVKIRDSHLPCRFLGLFLFLFKMG